MEKDKTVQFRISERDLFRIDSILPSGLTRSNWITSTIMNQVRKLEAAAMLRKEVTQMQSIDQINQLFPKMVAECLSKTLADQIHWRVVEDSSLGQFQVYDHPFSWYLRHYSEGELLDEETVSLTVTLPNNPANLNGWTHANLDEGLAKPLLKAVLAQIECPVPEGSQAYIEKHHLPKSMDIELDVQSKSIPELIREAMELGDSDSVLRVHHPDQGLLSYRLSRMVRFWQQTST